MLKFAKGIKNHFIQSQPHFAIHVFIGNWECIWIIYQPQAGDGGDITHTSMSNSLAWPNLYRIEYSCITVVQMWYEYTKVCVFIEPILALL